MPLERLVLILIIVIAAAAATVWIGGVLFVGLGVSPAAGLAIALPTALIGYVIVRVIADRVGNKEDDHYDRIEK